MRNACDSDSRFSLACDASARDAKSLAMRVERCEPLRGRRSSRDPFGETPKEQGSSLPIFHYLWQPTALEGYVRFKSHSDAVRCIEALSPGQEADAEATDLTGQWSESERALQLKSSCCALSVLSVRCGFYPVLPFLVFWEFLVFSPCEEFLVFLSVFPFFSKDFRGSVGIKNPCFFRGFPCLFPKKQGKEGQGILRPTLP